MSWLKTLNKISINQGNIHDLTTPCLKLYKTAINIAQRIEEPNVHGYLSPAQIAPHFEHIIYKELKQLTFKNQGLLDNIQRHIDSWYPTNNQSNHGKATNSVIKETFLAALSRVHTDISQSKSPYFQKEKKQWRHDYIEAFKTCFIDLNTMARAINDRQAIAKFDIASNDYKTYAKFDINELQQALISIKQNETTTYKINDERLQTTLKEAGFTTEELAFLQTTSILCYESSITNAQKSLMETSATHENTAAIKHNKKLMHLCYLKLTDENAQNASFIMKDQHEFQSQLKQLTKPYIRYQQAQEDLLITIAKPNINVTLQNLGKRILDQLKSQQNTPSHDLYELTNTLKILNKTISNPTFKHAMICSQQRKKINNHVQYQKTSSALLIIAGVATILASIAIALFSFGTLSPMSLLGIHLGSSLIVGGTVIGSGVLGAVTLTGGIKLAKANPVTTMLYNSLTQFVQETKTIAHPTTHEPSLEFNPCI